MSMGGGGGGKGGGGGTSSAERDSSSQLLAVLNQLNTDTTPVRQEYGNQLLEALQTGGVGATIPLVNASQQQSRDATSRALTGTEEQLSRAGLSRTPYAANTLATTRLTGEQRTGLIPSQIVSQMLTQGWGGAQNFGFGGLNAMTAGYGNLVSSNAQQNVAGAAAKGKEEGDWLSLLGTAASAYGVYAAAGAAAT